MKRESRFKLIIVLAFMLLVIVLTGSVFSRNGSTINNSVPIETPSTTVPSSTLSPAIKVTSTPEPTPEPTLEPTPRPTMPIPVDADGNYQIYGKSFNINDEEIILAHTQIDDEGALAASVIPALENLKKADFDSCGISNEAMAKIRNDNPDVEIIWRVNFGQNYTARTNIVKLLASMPSKGGDITNDDVEQLKYLTNIHYLDLGHNEKLSDFSFVEYMPELEIVVVSDTAITDLTPFVSCKKLAYLEAGNCKLSDLTPLADCHSLLHLNVGTNEGVKDITSLYGLDLIRLWLGAGDPVPSEQVSKMKELHPNCTIDTTCPTGLEQKEDGSPLYPNGFTMNGWKDQMQWLAADWAYYEANGVLPAARPKGYYKGIYTAFEYDKAGYAYAFNWNDPLYTWYNPDAEPIGEKLVDWKGIGEHSLIYDDWTWEEKYGSGVEKTDEQIVAEREAKKQANSISS